MRVVYISGCWDLFHVGHLNIIRRAATLGDYLVVGVITDEMARSYKGEPIIPFEQRRAIVGSLRYVDATVPHRSMGDVSGMRLYKATIRAVGPEYGVYSTQRRVREYLENVGVRYIVLPRTPDISTTAIRRTCVESAVGALVGVAWALRRCLDRRTRDESQRREGEA